METLTAQMEACFWWAHNTNRSHLDALEIIFEFPASNQQACLRVFIRQDLLRLRVLVAVSRSSGLTNK